MSRDRLKDIQAGLALIAVDYYNLGHVYPSGELDGATKKAIREVQGLLDVKKSGELDEDTVRGIRSLSKKLLEERAPKGLLAFEAGRVYAYGDHSDAVAIAQIMINRIARTYINVPRTDINGVMDIKTVNALAVLRGIMGDPGGQLDAQTWRRLLSLYYSVRQKGFNDQVSL